MNILPDLALEPGVLRVVKRPIPVAVAFARNDGVCETFEGPVPYRAGDPILTGIKGERWPVERAKFKARYQPAGNHAMGEDGPYLKRRQVVLAKRLEQPMTIRLPAGGELCGGPSDWLLQYAPDDYGIVAEVIFEATYEAAAPSCRD